jgi:hypothetical protein
VEVIVSNSNCNTVDIRHLRKQLAELVDTLIDDISGEAGDWGHKGTLDRLKDLAEEIKS